MSPLSCVVLAGGESRRFGSDKLDAHLAGRPLLHHVVAGVIAAVGAADLIVVGSARPLPYAARFVSEEPPGGGPAAGIVAGLEAALQTGTATVMVVPGDSPTAGAGAAVLLAALDEGGADAVVATDPSGREQPLQLALTRAGAAALIAAAGASRGAGESARALVARLDPPAVRFPVPADTVADVDRPEDLRTWADRLAADGI